MTHPVTFPPSQTRGRSPFTDHTRGGLFAAPFPSEGELTAAAELSCDWARSEATPDDLTPILGHLMAVRSHCLRAARADANAARILASEPQEMFQRRYTLPERVVDAVSHTKDRVSLRETLLNAPLEFPIRHRRPGPLVVDL